MKQGTEKDNRDQQLGRAIAIAVQQQELYGSCLSDEQLATLLDNCLPAGERERCMNHIASCDTCLTRYSTAAALLQDAPEAAHSSRGLLYAGLAIAVVAILTTGVLLQQHPGRTDGQLQMAGQGSSSTLISSTIEINRLYERLKTWTTETGKAIEAKQYSEIKQDVPSQLQQEARQLGNNALADKLEPLVRHLANRQDTDEWYTELGMLLNEHKKN